ncbi:MAG: hypothetical protein ACYDEX_18005 [Mobilitalea sp.]
MKGLFLALGIFLLSLTATQVAFAGVLGDNEAKVVEAAKGIYEFEGLKYQVDPSYINQLIEYFSSDDEDLTREQKDEVLQSVYNYIEIGVQEGYLIAVKDQTNQEVITPVTEIPENDTSEEAPGITIPDTDNSEIGDTDTGSSNHEEAEPVDDNVAAVLPTPEPTNTSIVDEEIGLGITVDNENDTIIIGNPIIKNTGFNLNRTVSMTVGMGMLMLLGIIVTIKYDYFAQSDE